MNEHMCDIRLSAQRALQGNVPMSLVTLSAEIRENEVWLRSILDGSATDEDRELLSCVGAEVIADYPNHFLHEEIQEHSAIGSMAHLKHLIFQRGT